MYILISDLERIIMLKLLSSKTVNKSRVTFFRFVKAEMLSFQNEVPFLELICVHTLLHKFSLSFILVYTSYIPSKLTCVH